MIVKGRTERQREAADSYKQQPAVYGKQTESSLPSTSWWAIPCSYEQFTAKVAQEQSRLTQSKFSRILGNATFE